MVYDCTMTVPQIPKDENDKLIDQVKCATRRAMREHGLEFNYLLSRIKYLCEATKPISCIRGKEADGGTVDFVDVPDNAAIAKGVDIALNLGAYYPEKKAKTEVDLKNLKIIIHQDGNPET